MNSPQRTVWRRTCLWLALIGVAPASLTAQELPILDPAHVQLITQEISGDAAYAHIRYMTQFHRPRGGADGLWQVAEYYLSKAQEYGLQDAQLIKQASTTRPWNARFADLWIVEPTPERIASTLQTPLHLADYSRPTDVTAELVDVGPGAPTDFEATDVAGKIILTHGSIFNAMREGVGRRGALGVVWYPDPFTDVNGISGAGISMADQIRWNSLPSQAIDGHEPTFAFVLSLRQGVALRNQLARATSPVRVHAVVDAAFESNQGRESWQVMTEAFIPGTEPDLGQDVVLTGHLQEEGTSANDDASGTASVAEVARALNRLIEDGRLPRPRRNLRFWWVTEISSERQYFADHPDAHRTMWVNINQDMVGANQALDVMRKQNITRLPATRFHFLNDVVESVIEYMVTANTFELAQLQAGAALYPKPHVSHLGSQHRYNAEMIFFHTNSDHMTFNEAPIGVPGVTFTNMPDRYIHSSDDDLWNIDPTQLGRNAASVALMAYAMASADSGSIPALTAETMGRGLERMGRNERLALTWIATAGDPVGAYYDAVDQVRFAAERERQALSSLADAHSSATHRIPDLVRELERRRDQSLREIDLAYRQATNARPPVRRTLTEVEARLEEVTPVLTAGPTEFLTARNRIAGVAGLHSLMAFEILNAVDGRRTALDILRYVAAEAREAGPAYYGTVDAGMVQEYLGSAEAAGVIELRAATDR